MRYPALASDYDGTLAQDGFVKPAVVEAVERYKRCGKKFLLVTGRRVPDLLDVFPQVSICDCVVAENGALLYDPQSNAFHPLASRPPDEFLQALRERRVDPVAVGEVIVATWEPHEKTVMEVIRDLGLELQIIFNKGAVMVLPAGVNKATGLEAALKEMGYSAADVVGIGDAENDHAFLSACGYAVAVSNSVEALKKNADLVTKGDHGDGVIELIEELLRAEDGQRR